jgi:hypothetical protein
MNKHQISSFDQAHILRLRSAKRASYALQMRAARGSGVRIQNSAEGKKMRKIRLAVESLQVQSFVTSNTEANRGTVVAHEPTRGRNVECGSLYDACPTGLCNPTFDPNACATYDPAACESADDACPSGRGCTEIDC